MLGSKLSKTIQTLNGFMNQTLSLQYANTATASVVEDRNVDISKVNRNVRQFSWFLDRELGETRSKATVSAREAIGMLAKRWKNMKDVERSFYSVIGDEEIGKSKSKKSEFYLLNIYIYNCTVEPV